MRSFLEEKLAPRAPRLSLRTRILWSLSLTALLVLPPVVGASVSAGRIARELEALNRSEVVAQAALKRAEQALLASGENVPSQTASAVVFGAGTNASEEALPALRLARHSLDEISRERLEVTGDVRRMQRNVVSMLLVSVLVLVLAAARLTRRITQPLERLGNALQRAGEGDLSAAADTRAPPELLAVAQRVNRLLESVHHRDELKSQRIRALRRTVEIIGQQIGEPTVVLDGARSVEYANAKFTELVACGSESLQGRSLTEVLRDPAIHRLLDRLYRGEEVSEPVRFVDARGQAHVRRLGTGTGLDDHGAIIRLVLVFAPVETV